MDRGILTIFLLGLAHVAVVTAQQLDPIVNFCRRIDHQCELCVLFIDMGGDRGVGGVFFCR